MNDSVTMLGFQGPAQSSPALVDAINSGLLHAVVVLSWKRITKVAAKVITTRLSCR